MHILEAFVRCGGEADRYEVLAESGHGQLGIRTGMRQLAEVALIFKPRQRAKWQITERGKIALALYNGFQRRLQAKLAAYCL